MKAFSLLLLCGLTLAPLNSHARFADDFDTIINGQRVGPAEPIAGSVVNVQMLHGRCTGTALSPTVVITAAHCPDNGGTVMNVNHRAGSGALCDTANVIEVSYLPGATIRDDGVHMPDISILHLETPLCGIKAAKIRTTEVKNGDVVTAAGYGQGTLSPDRPDRIQIRTIPSETVPAIYGDEDPVRNPNKNSYIELAPELAKYYKFGLPVTPLSSLCFGDSGGPVYQDMLGITELVGVNGAIGPHTMHGTPQCQYAYLQLFTPVAPYAAWINGMVKEWSAQ